MKKTVTTIILLLIFLVLTGIQFINLVNANPYIKVGGETVPPDTKTKPPQITIFSPNNNSIYSQNNVTLSLNVTVGESPTAYDPFIKEIYYTTDWQSNYTDIYRYIPVDYPTPKISSFNTSLELANIPEGKHNLTVYTRELGMYIRTQAQFMFFDDFSFNKSTSILFTTDTIIPEISVLVNDNSIYKVQDVPLNFVINENVSKISYVLDGQSNFTISGNITMPNLSNGYHNVTIYATDFAGNVGSSQTVTFTVDKPEPFPIIPVTASIAIVAIVTVSLLIYFKKHKH